MMYTCLIKARRNTLCLQGHVLGAKSEASRVVTLYVTYASGCDVTRNVTKFLLLGALVFLLFVSL